MQVSKEQVNFRKKQKSVTIHEQCRKTYTRKSSIAASKKRQLEGQEASTSSANPSRIRSRVRETAFCFKEQCLFCGLQLNKEYGKTNSAVDATAEAVLARVEFEHDLVACQAKYHHDCYVSFLRPTTGTKIGGPKGEATDLPMEEIFTYIENSDVCQFTIND